MMETRKCPFIILILAVGVIIAGCNGGPSCSDVGGPCDVDSDCCAGLICGGLYCAVMTWDPWPVTKLNVVRVK